MGVPNLSHEEQLHAFAELKAMVEAAGSIALCAHTHPDGDALGSVLGLYHVLKELWPEKDYTLLLADTERVPDSYAYLPGIELFRPAAEFGDTPELFLCVDVPQAHRLNDAQAVMERAARVATIDHHPAPEPLGAPHIQRTDAAAVGVLVYQLACAWEAPITRDAARCMLCAIMTDTGCFKFQNTDPEALAIASELVALGATADEVALNVYQSDRLAYLKLEARVVERIRITDDGKIAYSWSDFHDLAELGVGMDECDGLIDCIRRVGGPEVALLLRATEEGTVRGSIRSKGTTDISGVARALGGGGHAAASGFTVPDAELEDVLQDALAKLEALFEGDSGSAV